MNLEIASNFGLVKYASVGIMAKQLMIILYVRQSFWKGTLKN